MAGIFLIVGGSAGMFILGSLIGGTLTGPTIGWVALGLALAYSAIWYRKCMIYLQ